MADVQQEALEDAVGSVDFEQEKLEGIFREVFKLDEDEPVENARIGQGGWDSLRHLDLLMSIEDGLDVSFHDVGGNTLVSFPQILEVVREKKRHV